MNISEEIQKELKKLRSKVKLLRRAKSVGGKLPSDCAMYDKNNRFIHVGNFNEIGLLSVCISENGFCHARALIEDFKTIAEIFYLWFDKKETIGNIQKRISVIEIFNSFSEADFENSRIFANWNKIRNGFFRDEYLIPKFGFDICLKILDDFKNDPILKKNYLYDSLGRICFSHQEDNRDTYYLCVYPNRLQIGVKKYRINLPPDGNEKEIDNLEEAKELIKDNLDKIDIRLCLILIKLIKHIGSLKIKVK